jgi:predicted metal-binding membrane protein
VLESLLKRDRLIVVAALTATTVVSWLYLLWIVKSMSASMPNMPDMPGMSMAAPALHPWTASDFIFTFTMWSVMMVGMMIPSASPMILIYARVGRQAALQGKPLASTGWFAGGYVLSWTGFSLFATLVQSLLERLAGMTPMMTAATMTVGAGILIAAGLYQWTSLKDSCLQQCRAPLAFIQQYGGFKRTASGSLFLGLRHGIYCIGCCWALMALLFAGGVMNVFWIAAIAIFVLVEKIVPGGRVIARIAGVAFVAIGLWFLLPAR